MAINMKIGKERQKKRIEGNERREKREEEKKIVKKKTQDPTGRNRSTNENEKRV